MCVATILKNPVYKGEPAFGRVSSTFLEASDSDRNHRTGLPLKHGRSIRRPADAIQLTAPSIVSGELWEAAQDRFAANVNTRSGNPGRVRMLAGRVFCPCGHPAVLVGRTTNKYYYCGERRKQAFLTGEDVCDGKSYSTVNTEICVTKSILDATQKPEAIEAAIAAYITTMRISPEREQPTDLQREKDALDRALSSLDDEESAAVQAQIEGIRSGLRPDTYNGVFADLAARRKDLENRRGEIARALNDKRWRADPAPAPTAPHQQALADLALVLRSESIEPAEKRDLIGTVIERVICRPDGAEVHFLPNTVTTAGMTRYLDSSAETVKSTLTELMQ